MNWTGFILGDNLTRKFLNVKISDISLSWKTVDSSFRNIVGDLKRVLIKGIIPTIKMELMAVKDDDLAVLLGARHSQQELYLKLGEGLKVKRQIEFMAGANYFYLTRTSIVDYQNFKVYLKTDFNGTNNLYSSYSSGDRKVIIGSSLTVGTPVYVDYEFTIMKGLITAISHLPHKGASRKLWGVTLTFEGI